MESIFGRFDLPGRRRWAGDWKHPEHEGGIWTGQKKSSLKNLTNQKHIQIFRGV